MTKRTFQPETRGNINRRRLLAGGGALAGGLALAAPAVAQERFEWNLVTSWPKDAPGPGTTARRIAERITLMSGGRLTVKLFAAGEVVPAFEVFDAVSRGTAQMGHTASFFWSGKFKAATFFTAVPFGLTPDGHQAWIYHGGGQALWDELYASAGVKPFLAGNSGMQMGGWCKREIRQLEDLKGLKYRIPGLGGEVMRRLGVTAVSLPPGEILPALQSGAIDGAEFLGPWSDIALGLNKAAPYYYWPGFHEPNGSAESLVNATAYAALPDDLKEITAAACEAENARGLAEADWQNAQSLIDIEAKHGVKLRRFGDDILAAAGKAAEEVLAELGAGDALAGRIHASYLAARAASLGWAKVARHAVLDAELRFVRS
ncbi:MAG: TRAP transporter substrate-binding protein [Rhodospirillales bacterium]|nr:TRAP transporter substrate-binding protein [Rhodospirillales bacterium]